MCPISLKSQSKSFDIWKIIICKSTSIDLFKDSWQPRIYALFGDAHMQHPCHFCISVTSCKSWVLYSLPAGLIHSPTSGPKVVHIRTSIARVPARDTIVMQIKISWRRFSVAVDTYIWGLHGTNLQVLPTSIENLRNSQERLSTSSVFFFTYRAPFLILLKMAIAMPIHHSRVLRGVNCGNLG